MLVGLGSGCVQTPEGDCMFGGMPVSCSIIRECDNVTGNLHYEYGMPFSSGNVNINVANTNGMILGYKNADGVFVDTPDTAISSLTNAPNQAQLTQAMLTAIETARANALRNAQAKGLNAQATQLAVALAVATAARGMASNTVNTQAGTVNQGSLVNTPQTVTSHQGNPASASLTNQNAGNSGGLDTSWLNFDTLLGEGSWFSGTSFGIKNSWLALGALAFVATSGGGFAAGRRGR